MGLSSYLTKTREQLMWRFKRVCEERCYDDKQVWSFRTSKLSKEELAKLVCQLEEEDRGASVPSDLEKLGEKTLDYVTSELEVERAKLAAERRHRGSLTQSTFVDEKQEYLKYRRAVSEIVTRFGLAIYASPVNQTSMKQAVRDFAHMEGYADLGDAEAALTVMLLEWKNSAETP